MPHTPLTTLPPDYAQRLYAGVLGKIIGVYLGRPFEGWSYESLSENFGEITGYVHDRLSKPLIVTDDDISGTFTFVRAFEDFGFDPALTARQIGENWLNYIIEKRTILWWGGMGNSTEHTAFVRLKSGIPAPQSGSIALNGKTVAEQIGSQIFIDGWGLIAPGNPQLAAKLAKEASLVSHDGEAVYGAQIVAALVALAFVEKDLDKMLDTAVALIPADSTIARLIADLRAWHKTDGDWRITRKKIAATYGYDKFGGGCHMIPNHALIILALLYAPDNFQLAQTIVNTSGWDTDCNAGNVGCIMGVRLGLAALSKNYDFRTPLADRILLPTADGGRAITDALTETHHLLRAASALANIPYEAPKGGARYHFSLPGSVQGFQPLPYLKGDPTALITNAPLPTDPHRPALKIQTHIGTEALPAGVFAQTFIAPDQMKIEGYALHCSPTIYAGQTITADLQLPADAAPIQCRLAYAIYEEENKTVIIPSQWQPLTPGQRLTLTKKIPTTNGFPIHQLRLEIAGPPTTLFVDRIALTGTPDTWLVPEKFEVPSRWSSDYMWKKAFVDAADDIFRAELLELPALRICQSHGTGQLSIGTADWKNYRLTSVIHLKMGSAAGLAVAYRGLNRQLRVLLHADRSVTLERLEFSERKMLARGTYDPTPGAHETLAVEWTTDTIRVLVNDHAPFAPQKIDRPPTGGGIALLVTEGHARFRPRISPVSA